MNHPVTMAIDGDDVLFCSSSCIQITKYTSEFTGYQKLNAMSVDVINYNSNCNSKNNDVIHVRIVVMTDDVE
jgi:hypothetical protein